MNDSVDLANKEGFTKGPEYDMETPFLDRYEPEKKEEGGNGREGVSSVWQQLETPFISQMEMESFEGEDPQAQLYSQLLAELHDEEFDEVLSELVQEASSVYEERISQEFGDSTLQRKAAEEVVRDYLEPLVHETQNLLETIGQGLSDRNLMSASEDQLEEWFEQYEPNRSDLSPAFEDFLKGVWRKVKKVAKGVAQVAKKGLKVAATIATGGLTAILGKIKQLIRPLLNRVLRFAIGQLPPFLRPAASQLARRLLGVGETQEEAYEEEQAAPTGAETDNIQRELDVQMANSLMAENMEESETALAEYRTVPEETGESALDTLQDARARFVNRISQLQEGEDVRPALEEFIPAILPALKIGVKMIGRHRVVNFLAGLLSKLIDRFVGKNLSGPLSQAIVDTGLRLISLETTEEAVTRTAGNAVASTIEETIERLSVLPETVYEDFELLEAHALEAFEQAASSNFPAEMIKTELREATVNGTWVLMPINTTRKFYKKYTVVFERVLTPQTAARIKTFGGLSLATVLRDQLNLDPAKEYKIKVHIYESIRGTWLSRISAMERNVRGLGSPNESAWSQIHPLTPQAAASLLGEPGLGRDVHYRFLQDRNLIDVGQRFYYLEIEGVHAVIQPGQRLRRSSRVYVKIDCPGNKMKVALFLSERDAQNVATKLRQNSPWSAILRGFTSLLNSIQQNFTLKRNVRIVHESVVMEDYAGVLSAAARGAGRIAARALGRVAGVARAAGGAVAGAVGRAAAAGRALTRRLIPQAIASVIAEKVIEWSLRKISEYLRERKQEFIRATENPADGVTILITFANPGLLPVVCRALRGEQITLSPSLIPRGIPNALVKVYPGLRRG
jgi:hypothetical protein